MKRKTENMIKGLGVAMAVGSVIAGATATMGSNRQKTKKSHAKSSEQGFRFCGHGFFVYVTKKEGNTPSFLFLCIISIF